MSNGRTYSILVVAVAGGSGGDGDSSLIIRICNVGLVFSRDIPVDEEGILKESKDIIYLQDDGEIRG